MDVKNIMKSGEKILERFKINNEQKKKTNRLTNKILLKELVDHFSVQLEELSVGRKMIHPMAFNVLMHPDDYSSCEESLKFVLPEVISNFYNIIRERQMDYPNIDPTAKFWFFQFSPCEFKGVEGKDGDNKLIEKGKIATMASLVTFDLPQENIKTNTSVKFSIKPQNSVVNGDTNINLQAIRNLNFRGNSAFSFDYDKSLNSDVNTIKAGSDLGWARLTYTDSVLHKNVHFEMKDKLIYISGKTETRKSRSIFILEGEAISDSHVQIRLLPENNQSQIAAFGETRLNGRALELSAGGTLNWYNLPDNSQIFMNGTVAVKFKINR